MKFSCVMLISRNNQAFVDSVESVIVQQPNEFRAYVDNRVRYHPNVTKMLRKANAIVTIQTSDQKYFLIDHFINVVHNIFRGLKEAKHKWVRWNDDDDILLSDTRYILERYADDDIGFIHGDVLYRGGIRKSRLIAKPQDARWFIGSGNIYNRDAFLEVYPYLNGGTMIDHGRFWDWRVAYWMLRAGYRGIYVPIILSHQHHNPTPDPFMAIKRRSWFGKWPKIVEKMDQIPYIKGK